MLFLTYEAIVAMLVVVVTAVILISESRGHQFSGALVLVPLLLRLFGVK